MQPHFFFIRVKCSSWVHYYDCSQSILTKVWIFWFSPSFGQAINILDNYMCVYVLGEYTFHLVSPFVKFSPSVIRVIHKVALASPCLSPPYPLFQWYLQRKEILLNLNMECWNLAFNAQGSRLIIVVVQVWGVVAAVEALRKKKSQYETQFTTKIGGKTSLGPVISFCINHSC
jgi:hypothetical protein